MAETSVNIQPAQVGQGVPAPPKQLAMIVLPDGAGGTVLAQQVCLVDDQGDTYVPLTEATGMKILGILTRIHNLIAEQNNNLKLPDIFEPSDG
jgi:hypothetical protein